MGAVAAEMTSTKNPPANSAAEMINNVIMPIHKAPSVPRCIFGKIAGGLRADVQFLCGCRMKRSQRRKISRQWASAAEPVKPERILNS